MLLPGNVYQTGCETGDWRVNISIVNIKLPEKNVVVPRLKVSLVDLSGEILQPNAHRKGTTKGKVKSQSDTNFSRADNIKKAKQAVWDLLREHVSDVFLEDLYMDVEEAIKTNWPAE